MPTVSTQIEIAASPAEVRKTFFDFESYNTWAKSLIVAVEVVSGDKDNLKPGDQLKVSLTSQTFTATVVTNTPEKFAWLGSIPYIFTGTHTFHFQPSTVTPGHTTLLQEEEFSGLLSFLVGPDWSMGKQTKANFEGFNREIKERVEGS